MAHPFFESLGASTGLAAWLALAWRLARIPLLIYAGLILLLYFLQDRLIFPGRTTQGRREAEVDLHAAGAERVDLRTAAGDHVVAAFGRALTPDGRPRPDAASRPTLLYFYGNGSCLAASLPIFEEFRRLGVNVLIPDYVGYGSSAGRASEVGLYATADAALDHLRARPDVDPRRIVVAGRSLGAAVAIDLASRRPVAALAAFSAFTSMADTAGRLYPWLPVSILLRHRFESLRKIAGIRVPTFLGHGAADQLIPLAMSDRLAAAAAGPVVRWTGARGEHNEFFSAGGAEFLAAFARFLDGLP